MIKRLKDAWTDLKCWLSPLKISASSTDEEILKKLANLEGKENSWFRTHHEQIATFLQNAAQYTSKAQHFMPIQDNLKRLSEALDGLEEGDPTRSSLEREIQAVERILEARLQEMGASPWESPTGLYDIHTPQEVEKLLRQVEFCLKELDITPDTPDFHRLPDPIQAALTQPENRKAFCEIACHLDAGKGQLIAVHRSFCEMVHIKHAA